MCNNLESEISATFFFKQVQHFYLKTNFFRILSDDLGKNLENSRRKKGQYTSVNLIFVDFWWKIWILSDEWGHFFISFKKADNGVVFEKTLFTFWWQKNPIYYCKIVFWRKKGHGGVDVWGNLFFLILIVFSKKIVSIISVKKTIIRLFDIFFYLPPIRHIISKKFVKKLTKYFQILGRFAKMAHPKLAKK